MYPRQRWMVSIKAIDDDKDQQRHSIKILRAGYIGRVRNTMYPRQRWTVSIKDSYAHQDNRCWQGPTKTLDQNLHARYIGRDENTNYPRQSWTVSINKSWASQGNKWWQGPTKTLNQNPTSWVYRKRWEHSIHDKDERSVSRKVGHIKAIDVVKDQRRHSIEILHPR